MTDWLTVRVCYSITLKRKDSDQKLPEDSYGHIKSFQKRKKFVTLILVNPAGMSASAVKNLAPVILNKFVTDWYNIITSIFLFTWILYLHYLVKDEIAFLWQKVVKANQHILFIYLFIALTWLL